jgi:hypothetical protein
MSRIKENLLNDPNYQRELEQQEALYQQINEKESAEYDAVIAKTEWTTDELQQDFKVLGFAYGYCAVERKSDRQKGSLAFGGRPRKYFNFKESN